MGDRPTEFLDKLMTSLNSHEASIPPSDREIARRGRDLYDRTIRAQVETAANLGKIISIDIETGDYAIGEDLLDLSTHLQLKSPNAIVWAERIGFNAVYAVGGTLTKVDTL